MLHDQINGEKACLSVWKDGKNGAKVMFTANCLFLVSIHHHTYFTVSEEEIINVRTAKRL